MSVIVYTENWDGKFKKATYEAVTYAADLAANLGGEVTAVSIGNVADDELKKLGNYGAKKVHKITGENLKNFRVAAYAKVLEDIVKQDGAKAVVIAGSFNGKALAPRLGAKLNAGIATGVVSLPDTSSGFKVKKAVFSGKGFAYVNVEGDVKIFSPLINSYKVEEKGGEAEIVETAAAVESSDFKTEIKEVQKASGKLNLTEAEVIVSGGRGMKGPENWGMLEELAEELGAATACSKPVSDMDWRPHSEHVGQTGLTVRPNLYIAVGISGAIQHLAGVNASKTIVVINKDPEAPFFKAADYGIVGDAFDVVPRITEAVKKLKASQ